MTNHHQLLASVPLFAHLPVRAIDDLAKTAVTFFVISDGTAEVLHERNSAPVSTLRAGDCFGEMALIDGQRRSATVRAATLLTCVALTRWDFLALVRSDAGLAVGLLEEMSRRVRTLEGPIAENEGIG